MNREIKFRGYSEKEKRWVKGCYLRYSESIGYIYEDLFIEDGMVEVETKSVGQYIGLKDKNGLEIYEGDVVKWVTTLNNTSKSEHIDTIKWCNDVACYLLMPFCHEPHGAKMEVIGNIHQHPNLIDN